VVKIQPRCLRRQRRIQQGARQRRPGPARTLPPSTPRRCGRCCHRSRRWS